MGNYIALGDAETIPEHFPIPIWKWRTGNSIRCAVMDGTDPVGKAIPFFVDRGVPRVIANFVGKIWPQIKNRS